MHDIHLHYIEKGSGKPLILLHGNGEDSRYFKHQIRFFSRSRRVLAVDTRGHGKTKRGTKPFTIRQFAEDLAVFLKEKGIHKADIIGFSDGGNIAIIFAIRFPEKVENFDPEWSQSVSCRDEALGGLSGLDGIRPPVSCYEVLWKRKAAAGALASDDKRSLYPAVRSSEDPIKDAGNSWNSRYDPGPSFPFLWRIRFPEPHLFV